MQGSASETLLGNILTINFYDVGHGNCTHIITPNGKNILVDIGSPWDNSISYYFKNTLQIEQIDLLCITHTHKDHIYDLPNLVEVGLSPKVLCRDEEAFPVNHMNISNDSDRKIQSTANDINIRYNQPVSREANPMLPENNGGVSIEVIYSRKGDKKSEDPNTYSSIISVQYAGWKILLTGDNDKNILKTRIEEDKYFENFIKGSDVLLAPHHGRDTDFCKEFFDIANPFLTIVSDKKIEHDSQILTATNYTNSKSLKVKGEDRHVLTTRKDGTIKLKIYGDGKYSILTGATSYGK